MNTVDLVGKIASEIKLQEFAARSGGDVRAKASFLIAVRRAGGRRTEGRPMADMIRIETWGTQARNLVKFNDKGSRVAVKGRIRGEFYNPDGGDRGGQLRTVVVAEEIVYLTPPATDDTATAAKGAAKAR